MSKSLKVNIVKKQYKEGSIKILDNCRFEVSAGEFVTILGPSGCGKSTILKMIVGLDDCFEGDIYLGDEKVVSPSSDCSIIFQESRLLPWKSIKNNILFPLNSMSSIDKDEADKLLKYLDLYVFRNEFPSSLSGGMLQKAALARALINVPNLLLLDEPFASLDYMTRMQLQEELVKVLSKRRATVLMVTHDIEEAIFCSDRILIMSKKPGKIVTDYKVNLKFPKQRTSDDFLNLYKEILKYMDEKLHLV